MGFCKLGNTTCKWSWNCGYAGKWSARRLREWCARAGAEGRCEGCVSAVLMGSGAGAPGCAGHGWRCWRREYKEAEEEGRRRRG